MVNVAVIGCGYWGPNYIRVFNEILASRVSVCCDIDVKKLNRIKNIYSSIRKTTDYLDVLNDPEIDAVCVSTPASTHYRIAKDSLLHGKHVLVEKPFTLSVDEGKDLIKISRDEGRTLMVGHVYLYHPVVQRIKDYIKNNEIGDVFYLYSIRTGLGPIRRDVNAMWDLAPHDISIYLYLFDCMPTNVSARGASYIQKGVEDVVFTTLEFPRKIIGYMLTSWLDPYKVRKLTIIGSKKMIVFDDVDPFEKLKMFDKGASVKESHTSYDDFLLQVRTGDVYIPKVDSTEPLKNQCQHFIECIKENKIPSTNGEAGLNVVRVLEAANKSLKNSGALVTISE